jgi:hypothetical protein
VEIDSDAKRGYGEGYRVSLDWPEREADSVCPSITWRELTDVTPNTSEEIGRGGHAFHCLPNCYTAGPMNPIGLNRSLFYELRDAGGAERIWAHLDRVSGNGLQAQLVVGDEAAWWMGAAIFGKMGVTTSYSYSVRRYAEGGNELFEGLRVMALRPDLSVGRAKRLHRKGMVRIPVHIGLQGTVDDLADMEVTFVASSEAADKGMGDGPGDHEMERLENLIRILHGGK